MSGPIFPPCLTNLRSDLHRAPHARCLRGTELLIADTVSRGLWRSPHKSFRRGRPLLGLFRFVLALMVVFQHLSGHRLFAYFGIYAVMGFYVVSGYLMTAVLNETYRFDPKRFWANRFLRLFPIYYVVAAITAVLVFTHPDDAGKLNAAWQHFSWHDIPGQLLIFPYELRNEFRIVPPTWSVSVEIVNYALLWIVIARDWRLALTAFVLSGAYHIDCLWNGLDWVPRYSPFYAAVLPFSIGALTFFALKRGLTVKGPVTAIAIAAFIGNTLITGLVDSPAYITLVGWYLDIVLITVILAGLAPLRDTRLIGKIDRKLGDLAYPVFLVHWLAGLVVVLAFEPMITRPSPLLLIAALPLIIIVSALLAWAGEKMIEPIRHSIRSTDLPRLSTPGLTAMGDADRLTQAHSVGRAKPTSSPELIPSRLRL